MRQAAQASGTAANKIEQQFNNVSNGGRRMSASVNELKARLDAINKVRFGTTIEQQFRSASREAARLEQQISRLENFGKDNAGGLFNSIHARYIAGGAALAGATAFASSSVEAAMNYNATSKSFEVLTGNAERGKQLAQDLNQLQQSTILGPEVFKSAQTLLSFGIAVDKVIPVQKQLGDVSMGNKDKFDALTLAFAQTQSAGKLMGQDLLQYINAGFNPLAVMSEHWQEFGFKSKLTVGELKDAMSEGSISAQMVAKAFEVATSKGGKFADMMETMSQTTSGRLQILQGQYENLKIQVGNALMPLAEGLMNVASKTLDFLNVSKSVPQSLMEERGEISSLLGVITSLNQGNDFRGRLLQQLNTKYPDLFKNIDLEKVKNQELLTMLKDINATYNNRIGLASSNLIIDNAKNELAEAQREYTRYATMLELEKRGEGYQAHKMATIGDQFSWGYNSNNANDRMAWIKKQSDHYEKIVNAQQGIINNENQVKATKEFAGTIDEAYRLAHNPDRLKQVFGEEKSRNQNEFIKLANQISFSNGKYYTHGGGLAFASKLNDLMNPSSSSSTTDGTSSGLENIGKTKSDNISGGGQRTITINIGKQIETFEVHVMNAKETAQEYESIIRESMRRVLYNINSDAS
jgi:hypothetical protein